MQTPRTEFAQALHAIAQERGLDPDVIVDTIKQAIIAAYKRDARERLEETETFDYDVDIDPRTGEAKVFAWPLVKETADDGTALAPEDIEAKKEEAKKAKKDITPPGFGRIAAQTAKQVIHQKIREAEKGVLMDEYQGRVGSLVSGMILRFDGPDVRVDMGKAEGLMTREERVPNERLNANQRLSFLLKAIDDTPKGKQIVLSRADPLFVKKLFEREVPEISSGSVEIKLIAREPGVRTKMAVYSNQSGVDPVGSCVGQKGVRVQAITNELGGERVDIIPWTQNEEELVKSALSPAENLTVTLKAKEKTAIVKAPEDQLSMAIGRDGQNARLAAKLTGWKIEIKEDAEAKVEAEKKTVGIQDTEKLAEKSESVGQLQPKTDRPMDENSESENEIKQKEVEVKVEEKQSDTKATESTEDKSQSAQKDGENAKTEEPKTEMEKADLQSGGTSGPEEMKEDAATQITVSDDNVVKTDDDKEEKSEEVTTKP